MAKRMAKRKIKSISIIRRVRRRIRTIIRR